MTNKATNYYEQKKYILSSLGYSTEKGCMTVMLAYIDVYLLLTDPVIRGRTFLNLFRLKDTNRRNTTYAIGYYF